MSANFHSLGLLVHGLAPGLSLLATTTTAAKKSTSSYSSLIIIIVIFGALYFLFIRPRSQRARAAQRQTQQANVGDEVMLTSGIIGRITEIEGDRASVEIAPDIEVEVVRRAIGQILVPGHQDFEPDDAPQAPGRDRGLPKVASDRSAGETDEEHDEAGAGEEDEGGEESESTGQADSEGEPHAPGEHLDVGGEGHSP
jgi:preprotein translocase subunit YajC